MGSSDHKYSFMTSDYDNEMQNQLESPMPWIGMYIAAASAVCSIAMAADAFNGIRSKKFWFPSAATKLPVDITTQLMGVNDKLARLSGLIFMSSAMGNFMKSLGSMENNEIMLNLAALSILVITVLTNNNIYMGQLRFFWYARAVYRELIASCYFMVFLLVALCSLAIMVPTAKTYIESAYQEMHRRSVSNEQVEWRKLTIDELRTTVTRYWVMAQTGSPQFVIARSVSCTTSGMMCLLVALTLLEAHIRMPLMYKGDSRTSSHYKWSVNGILVIQSIGVAFGSIAPVFRWFVAAKFKSSKMGHKNLKDELKVENYWTQVLVDWKESPLPLKIRHHKFRKLLHDAKGLFLSFCIGFQVLIVRVNKLVLLVSAYCAKVIHIKNFKACDYAQSRARKEQDFSRYVVLLEGEVELPTKSVNSICNEVDKLIRLGKKKQHKNLIKLLKKSVNFNGVIEFDNKQIRSLNPQEPPNCWSLPIVTLTSIAFALPDISVDKSIQLLRGVSESLYFVKLIEKALHRNGELASIMNASDVAWLGVELYHKWQDIDIRGISFKSQSHRHTLQELSDIAKNVVIDFKTNVENPLSWPTQVTVANSMYRISQTIMQANKDSDSQIDEDELFERLSIIISNILSACLTNLVRVITLKCHCSAIKEREKSVRQAALLLGESEQILEILRQHELPRLDPEKAAYIDEWRAFMEQDSENPMASVSAACTTLPHANGEQVIELEG